MKQEATEKRQYCEDLEAEERKLQKIIAAADAEKSRQKKELDQVCEPWNNHSYAYFKLLTQSVFLRFRIYNFLNRLWENLTVLFY